MGLMRGRVTGDTFLVLDAFPLPVEGTETRVNAQSEAYEYMVDFLETCKLAGRPEHVVGWYHSHPGYGCWLSGIDVSTQLTNQMYQEPFLAIVIDPHRTASAGRVEIGAFRTYPEGHKLALDASSEYQTIPMDKIEDFGVHANQYYSLDISYFKSSMDVQLLNALWDRHWVNTLAASPLLMGQTLLASQITDIAKKIRLAESQTASSRGTSRYMHGSSDVKTGEGKLEQAVKDASALAREQAHGLSVQVIKEMLFRRPCCSHWRSAAGKPMEV
ncbi:hypothetical protein H632_c1386p0 [Helicosporidium sp. ATCC 50920]|nr:hypothetical protein H632_c1386p0 [Helicosporidium sp. ATCC 50920]|eukprot:KDD74343.1 hypothetical protein H632_c1386p0 [Helicosporidium sp. ATCC 50920]